MKVIVTHYAPDWDAICSVWLIKTYLPGWDEAVVEFVPHGSRLTLDGKQLVVEIDRSKAVPEVIEHTADHDLIHVDTGLGPLDHHETEDQTICASTRCLEYVKKHNDMFDSHEDKWQVHEEALERITVYMTALDHFQEVFWPEAATDRYDFSIWAVLEGYKAIVKGDNDKIMQFGLTIMDILFHRMEGKIWSERELRQKGKEFQTQFGKGIAIETLDDDVVRLAEKLGYAVVIRKDPRKGYVRIKALPQRVDGQPDTIDLTRLYERLIKIDSRASWYLHVSKRMILNTANKEVRAVPTTLSLAQVVALLLELYR